MSPIRARRTMAAASLASIRSRAIPRMAAAAILLLCLPAVAEGGFPLTHRYANTDARSLIGLPSGSQKTIVTKEGNLLWSHWSLKDTPLNVPFGFSEQMDGALTIAASLEGSGAFRASGQELWEGRFPFIVTHLEAGGVKLDELAFAAGVIQAPVDGIRLRATNPGDSPARIVLTLSGRDHNLPAHAGADRLRTKAGVTVAIVERDPSLALEPGRDGFALFGRWTIPARATRTIWIRAPHIAAGAPLPTQPGAPLFKKAEEMWRGIWNRGIRVHWPEKGLNDFFDSSIAYVMILTEYGHDGDLWLLDGPGSYRQYWGRGEYFQARALEVSGHQRLARQSVEHALHIQMPDGEWDGPPVAGWPAWDNTGGNAGAAWDYYLYSRDRKWLASAYPHLLAAARWIREHREESEDETYDLPEGAKPIRRQIPSKCRPEPNPPLAPGEKPYWYGLLPWSYGDSGLPQGHSFGQNFFALYAVQTALNAARVLGDTKAATWLAAEHADYLSDIQASVDRALPFEKEPPPYLPAMPTYPEAAYSQTFVGVYPTGAYSPEDPLVSGLLTRMERQEKQGLPTNVAWLGLSGVWPGEAMNIAETYLLRGQVKKTSAMLLAALNHSYTTNVWKEEMRVDNKLPRACLHPSSKIGPNQTGTGDMPEGWANANMVNLVRDMLVLERNGKLELMAGVPDAWISPGQRIGLGNAPTSLGSKIAFMLLYLNAHRMELTVTPSAPVDVSARLPLDLKAHPLESVRAGGREVKPLQVLELGRIAGPVKVEITFR